jgi:hypothetical protein
MTLKNIFAVKDWRFFIQNVARYCKKNESCWFKKRQFLPQVGENRRKIVIITFAPEIFVKKVRKREPSVTQAENCGRNPVCNEKFTTQQIAYRVFRI